MNSLQNILYIKQITNLKAAQEPLIVITGDSDFLKQHSCLEIDKLLTKEKAKSSRINTEKISYEEIGVLTRSH